jgi:hypothetical protein
MSGWGAAGKWAAGIVATVLGGVLTFVIIQQLDRPSVPSTSTTPTVGPTTNSPVPVWQGPMSADQLSGALAQLPSEWSRVEYSNTPGKKCDPLDASFTVLGAKGRFAGPRGAAYSRQYGGSTPKDEFIDVRQDLASYDSSQDATSAFSQFGEWTKNCAASSGNPELTVEAYRYKYFGTASSAATVLESDQGSPYHRYSLIVVVQLYDTVTVLTFSTRFINVDFSSIFPHEDETQSIVSLATDGLKGV